MEEYIDDFIAYLRSERKYSDYTETNYLIDLENYKDYLFKHRLNFKNVEYKNLVPYIKYLKEDMKLNASSINRHLSTLRSFYNYLLVKTIVKNNPFKIVNSQKKEAKLPNYMKYNEFTEMIDSLGNDTLGIRNKALLELLFATGVRVSELVSIKVNDLDFDRMEIKVRGKGNKERIVYFNHHAKESLQNYLKNSRPELLKNKISDYLFINHVGGVLTTRGVRDIIDRVIKNCALSSKITPHTFRHTFATMLLNEGCDLKCVQELLGHASLSTTQIYTHTSINKQKNILSSKHPRNKLEIGI